MRRVAVFIDGGYLGKCVASQVPGSRIDYEALVKYVIGSDSPLVRAYYYDCLPYISNTPTEEEKERLAKKMGFLGYLEQIPRVQVRSGKVKPKAITGEAMVDGRMRSVTIRDFQQKGVDVALAVDLVRLASKGRIDVACIMTGDSDFVPVIDIVKDEGVLVRLFYCAGWNVAPDLWRAVDERVEITREALLDHVKEDNPQAGG